MQIWNTVMRNTKSYLSGLFFLFCFNLPLKALEQVEILTYHDAPPFIIDSELKTGLTYQLADYFQQHSDGKFQFNVTIIPRARLNLTAASHSNYLIPWTHPDWFSKIDLGKGVWSESYYQIGNCLVHLPQANPNTEDLSVLFGKKIAGLRGGTWEKLDELVENKLIERIDVNSYLSAYRLVEVGRVDFAIIPKDVYDYINSEQTNESCACTPFGTISNRHIFIKGSEELTNFIENEIKHFNKEDLVERP